MKVSKEQANEASKQYFKGDELAASVFVNKYALRDDSGDLLEETPHDMHVRLAKEFARIEEKYPNPMSEEEILELFLGFGKVVPQGSPMSAIGNTYKLQSASNCFAAGTKVHTMSGVKNIEDVQLGDLVVTHNGRIKPVMQLHKNALAGRILFALKAYRTPQINVTENHELMSISQEQLEWGSKPRFNPISYLRTGDWIQIPNLIEDVAPQRHIDMTQIFDSDGIFKRGTATFCAVYNDDKSRVKFATIRDSDGVVQEHKHFIPAKISLDSDFAYFLGLWYGDGCIFSGTNGGRRDRVSKHEFNDNIRGITFTLGSHEEKIVSSVTGFLNRYDIAYDLNNNSEVDSTIQIVVHSTFLACVFEKLFGRGYAKKTLHSGIFSWSKENIFALMQGLVDSDGTITQYGDIRVVMANKQFVSQVYHLLRSRGICVGYSETTDTARLDFGRNDEFRRHSSKKYADDRVSGDRSAKTLCTRVIDGKTFVKIMDKKIASSVGHDFVYTFGVEDDHSYSVEGLVSKNCFVIDSPLDSYSGICYTDQQQAQIMKRRGGVGFDISKVRPKGLPTKNAAGTTDGIGIFMERFSNTCREVAQNGRRGALMITIDCHHPEIMTFIDIKRDLTKVTGANISIRWSDEFLAAVESNDLVELRFPVEKNTTRQVSKFVNAKEVWDKFIDSAWTAAEPGCLFWDTAIKKTPSDIYSDEGYSSLSTNPCVTGDTWVHAGKVIRQVKDLIGDSQGQNKYLWEKMIVDGKPYNVTSNGFFSNGVKKVFQLETNEGFKLKLTADHKLMLADGSWAEVQSIREGEKIRLHDHREYSEWQGITGSDDQGYVLGMLVGDGTFSSQGACVDAWEEDSGSEKNIIRKISNFAMQLPHRSDFKGFYECSLPSGMSKFRLQTAAITDLAALYGIVRGNKVVTTRVEQGSPAFYKGFLRGFFDADGSVQGNQSKGCSIKLTQINLENLEAVQRMLLRLGIFSTIYKRKEAGRKMMPDGKGGMKEYPYEDLYELIITSNHLVRFADMVGFEHTEKMHKLNTIIANYKRAVNTKEFLATFKSLTYIGEEEVFDITVDNVHAFDANGFYAHNCGEIVLSKNDSCRLITMNSSTYVTKPFTKEAGFDYDLFATDAGKAQRLMDDLVDLEIELVDKIIAKVQNDPEPDHIKQIEINLWQDVRKAAINGRRTGLGITAIGDTVAALGLRYGSPESIKVVEEIYKALALGAYRSSVQMAKERGAFPIFSHEKEKGHEFLEQIWAADPVLYAEYQRYGRRNIALTTTAPTGSVSTMTQTTSGIEPVFMTHYKRRKKINPNDKDARVDFVDQLGDKWQEYTVYHHGVQRWMDVTGENDIAKSPYHGATANEIDWEAAVDLQAAAQKWICHAISKTTNLPNSATKEDVDKVYRRGWKTGCKGITVYRDGCRSGVLVAVDAKENDKKETLDGRPTEIKQTHAPRRPDSLPCEIHHVSIKGTKWVILVGLMGGKPYEMFAGAADSLVLPSKLKAGEIRKVKNGAYSLHVPTGEEDEIVVKNIVTTFDNAESAWATRMISMSLRHGVDVEFIVTQLSKDGAITDINKVLSRVLKKYIDNDKSPMTKCKDCGSSNVMFAEGCLTCKDCGSSKC